MAPKMDSMQETTAPMVNRLLVLVGGQSEIELVVLFVDVVVVDTFHRGGVDR